MTKRPEFWSGIANDRSRPPAQRTLALVQLVRHHVSPGRTTLGALAALLDGARWLGDGDIVVVTALGGKVPVTWTPEDTIAAVALPGGHGALYLAIVGLFSAEELTTALRGASHDDRILSAVIREVGFQLAG